MANPIDLKKNPLHLGLGACARVQPDFDGTMEWYQGYGSRNEKDGLEGRLLSMHSFTVAWDVWEMHPKGSEVVIVTEGAITLIQEVDGAEVRIDLVAGQAAVNPPGVWHTADVSTSATAVFITAGVGTEHRPR